MSTTTLELQLRQRIVELEEQVLALKQNSSDAQKLAEDSAHLRLELLTAQTNAEILQGNTETLRALCLQLAVQLEESNLKQKTLSDQLDVASMKAERDKHSELARVREEYEERLETLRAALGSEEDHARRTMILWNDREEAAERRIAQLEREKDRVINSLSHEVEILRQGLYDAAAERRQIAAASHQGRTLSTSGGVHAPTLGKQPVVAGTAPSSSSPSHRDTVLVERMSNLVVLTVALPAAQADALRFGDDEAIPFAALSDKKRRKFHVDLLADPSILETVEVVSPPPPPLSSVSESGIVSQRWAFRLPTDEQLILSAQVI